MSVAEIIQQVLPIAITVSLAMMVAAVGLDAGFDALISLFRQPVRLAKAVLAVNVIVPLAAVILIWLFPVPPAVRGGIVLMAVSPMSPFVPSKRVALTEDKSYGYGLYASLALLSIVIVPLTVAILANVYEVTVPLGVLPVAKKVALSVLLPLAVGLVLRQLLPGMARRLALFLQRIGQLVLVLCLVPIIVVSWSAMVDLAGNGALLAMALTSAIALTGGYWLGGPEAADRQALATTAAGRHPGLALMIAGAAGADKSVTAAIV